MKLNDIPIYEFPTRFAVLILTFAASIPFYKSLYGDFVFDDTEAVVKNKDIKSSTPVSDVFFHDFWGTSLDSNASHKSFRPLTILLFRLIRTFSDEPLPFPFHLVNLVLHALVTVLVYFAYRIIYGINLPNAAFLSALLFAVHPVHTECVAGIVGQAELLSAFFAFSSFIIYHLSCTSNSTSVTFSVSFTVISCLFSFIAMLCKEQGISMIAICSIYDVVIVNRLTQSHLTKVILRISQIIVRRLRKTKFHSENNRFAPDSFIGDLKYVISSYGTLLIRQLLVIATVVSALYFRWKIMGSKLPTFQPVDNPASFESSLLNRILNYNYIYAINLWIMLYPKWLCFDWSMGCIPLLSTDISNFDLRILVIPLLWILLIALSKQCFFYRGVTQRCLIMGFSSMIILFLPASNVLFNVGFVVAERVLYLPSFGFYIIIVIGTQNLFSAMNRTLPFRFIIIVLVASFIVRSMERSEHWLNEKVLFESALSVCPLNAKVHFNLGKNAADSGNKTMAVKYYQEALRLYPKYDQAMNNLANLLKDMGRLKEAENLLSKAVTIRPDFPAAWMNLGIVHAGLKNYDKSVECYKTALKYRKKYPDCYYNLGNLYLEWKKYSEAFTAWQNAVRQKQTHTSAWCNMIIMFDSLGQYEKAKNIGTEAVRILPHEPSINFNMAVVLGKLDNFEQAEKHFLQAIELNPNITSYHVNLGVLYHRWNKYCEAKRRYDTALMLEPSSASAKKNLRKLQKVMNVELCNDEKKFNTY